MILVVMVYYTYLDRLDFFLPNDISLILYWKLKNRFFHFYFLNSDISGNIKVINMKLCVRFLKVCIEGKASQTFDSGLCFNYISKNG